MINKIIDEEEANSTTFWKIRRRIIKGKTEEYETIDKEGEIGTKPDRAKDHIADYFENLYTAREGDENYQEWTEAINERIEEITREKNDEDDNNEITRGTKQSQKTAPNKQKLWTRQTPKRSNNKYHHRNKRNHM